MKKLLLFIFVKIIFASVVFAQQYCGPYTTISGKIQADENVDGIINNSDVITNPDPGQTSIIQLTGYSNLTIDRLEITNPNGHCIELINCNNVTITHCYLHDAQSAAIKLYNCTNITVTENRIQDVDFGILAVGNPKPKRKSQISKYK